MKHFVYVIFFWFVLQLAVVSAAGGMNDVRTHGWSSAQMTADCYNGTPAALAFVAGAMFPITEFTFIKGDFCWNQ